MKLTVYMENEQEIVKFSAKHKRLIKKAIKYTLKYEGFKKNAEVSVTLCDNAAIREMNRQFRDKDAPTDVLSFPIFDEDFGEGFSMLGDIVISLERARDQAEEYGHSFEREIAFLTVHSTLHLLGYDHEVGKAEESEMFAKQKEILGIMHLNRK